MNIIYLHTSLKKCGPTSQLVALLSRPKKSIDYYLFLLNKKNIENLKNDDINIINSLSNLLRVISQINHQKYIIHSSGILPDLILFLVVCFNSKNLKAFSTVRNIPWEDYVYRFSFFGYLLSYLHLFFLRKLNIICCSYSVYEKFLNYGFKKNLLFVDNSFTLETEIKEEIKIDGKIKLFTLSPIIKRKQVLNTIKIFKNLDFDFSFHIYGNGEEKKKLIRLIRNDSRFVYKGFIKTENIKFNNYDALVSLSLSEGLPNSVIEALCFGKYAILSDITSHKYISKFSRKAIILRNYDKSEIISILKYLLLNRINKTDLYKFRKYFSKERMIEDYNNIYGF